MPARIAVVELPVTPPWILGTEVWAEIAARVSAIIEVVGSLFGLERSFRVELFSSS